MSKTGRPKNPPARVVTYKGESKTVEQWAKDSDLLPVTINKRLAKYDKGEMSLDDVFRDLPAPVRAGGTLGITSGGGRKIGKRARALDALFDAFEIEGVPRLPDEMRRYMETNGKEVGPALAFFSKYASFFPKEALESLDGDSAKQVATVAVIVANQQPTNYTIIDQ